MFSRKEIVKNNSVFKHNDKSVNNTKLKQVNKLINAKTEKFRGRVKWGKGETAEGPKSIFRHR